MIQYLAICAAVFLVFMMLGTTILIIYTTNQAEADVARRMLAVDANQAGRHVQSSEDGTFRLDPQQEPETEQCFIVLLSDSEGLLDGDYPAKMQEAVDAPMVPEEDHNFRVLETKTGNYYVFDRLVRMAWPQGSIPASGGTSYEPLKGVCTRAIIAADDLHTEYQDIRKLYYYFLAVLICILLIGGIWTYRRAARPVKELCDRVTRISESPDYSERIENPGVFYETEIMSEAYNKLMERTERLALQQEEFNENVSHELRTPVTLIRSECELIEETYGDNIPEDAALAISVIHKQIDRMNAMIAELLYLARLERDAYELHPELVDLSDLAESVCEDAEDAINGRWKFAGERNPAEARFDVPLIMIAVRNLISNAMKNSPEGSTVEVSTGTDQGMAWLRVRDEGIGISEEDQKKIFEPYYQVKGERNSPGFGLGLTLAEKIARKHGGSIQLTSVVGQGSAFTLMLPAEQITK